MDWPKGTYDVILIDPPWDYYGDGNKMAAARKHYDLMTYEQICELPISDLLRPRGALFLWATCPRLDWAVDALTEWGLYYRGVGFVWIKTKADGTPIKAQGVRPSFIKPLTELVLIGAHKEKGRPMPIANEAIIQTIFAPRREHSRKPNVVRKRIEQLYPGARRLEMFARENVNGWYSWGLEKDKFNRRKK